MSVDYGLFRFASAPRTATTWVRQAAALAGLRENGRTEVHRQHDARRDVLRVSCVRHPAGWLASYFAAIHPGHVDVPPVDVLRVTGCAGFDQFLRHCLEATPGQVQRVFAWYDADVVLRVEDLPWAFVGLLETLGVPRSLRERCLALGSQNVTPNNKRPPRPSPSLLARVLEAEQKFLDEYEY